ncbi:MAG: methyltransferase domain-containing protein [Lachnospiraceae bacterium]|nr:methyltransferase domain-containing protein [Lachnospiraceae bacterium]
MDQVKIGRFIAKMRKQQKLTQREFADALGISDKTVSKWECGNGMPELSFMQPICRILNISLNELFSGEKLSDADYKKKAEENMMELVKEAEKMKKNIVGGKDLGYVNNVEMSADEAHKANAEFWSTIGSEFLGATALPSWGNFFPSEDKLKLLGDLSGAKVLEIGCGNGRSLKYAADSGAAELWGLDISADQIERTKNFLKSQEVNAELVCSPMEEECGLPTEYFDLVYSVYGIGWTTDLDKTFRHVHSYLKKGGAFVFGWSHPIHKCVSIENGNLIFSNSYFNEEWYRAGMGDKEIMLSNRMLSTYINTLADNGFVIEKLVEEIDREKAMAADNDFGKKALMLPTVFVIKARKM